MMRRTILACLVVCLAAMMSGSAQQGTATSDPIVGTWKLNFSQSKFSPRERTPKQHTEVYRMVAFNRIELTLNRVRGDGSLDNFKGTWPVDGGVVEEASDIRGFLIVEGLIRPGEWVVTQMQDGKQIATIQKRVSKDGKTMRQVVKGVDAQGQSVELLQVFDRQ